MRSRLAGLPLFVLAVALAAVAFPAWAAQSVHVRIDGEVQGWIKGDSTVQRIERVDTIEASEFHHLVSRPTGGGTVQHETVILTKPFDRATVPLWRAFDTSETLTVRFRFFRAAPGGTGEEQEYYNVVLSQARVVGIEPLSPSTLNPEFSNYPAQERIRFEYQTMTVEWKIGVDDHTLSVP